MYNSCIHSKIDFYDSHEKSYVVDRRMYVDGGSVTVN